MNAKVSVITVCYNAASEIERTIKSVVNQTYLNVEYLIIDGASKDGTLEVVKRYSDKINLVISEPDKGIYDAMNKGISHASGEWVVLMNAGDVFASDTVLEEIFSKVIPSNTEFIYSDAYILHNQNWVVCPMDFEKGALIHQCVIYKKKLHETIGLYIVTPKLIVSDYLFFIQVPLEKVMKTPTIIAKYEGGGASSNFPARTFALCADVVFRRKSFAAMLRAVLMQKVGDLFPSKLKYKIKKYIFGYGK